MPQSFAKLLVHLVFSTKNRHPFLPPEPFDALHQYARGILVKQKCYLVAINNVPDHVHLLFDLHRTTALADVVMHIKKGTSRWLKTHAAAHKGFDWQDGYGAFAISHPIRDEIISYIQRQQEHHQQQNFQDEYREWMRSYGIDFDERYGWD